MQDASAEHCEDLRREAWSLLDCSREILAAPGSPDHAAWWKLVGELLRPDPWSLPDYRGQEGGAWPVLNHFVLLSRLAPLRPARQEADAVSAVRRAVASAAALAARLRWHDSLSWLASVPDLEHGTPQAGRAAPRWRVWGPAAVPEPERRNGRGGPPLLAATEARTLHAVAALRPDWVPDEAPEAQMLRTALVRLASLRRGDAPREVPPELVRRTEGNDLLAWLAGQLLVATCWALRTGDAPAEAELVGRAHPRPDDSWVLWLASGRQEPLTAAFRAQSARYWARALGELARPRASARQRHEAWQDAAEWWQAEHAGWMLLTDGGQPTREAIRACRPAVLTGDGPPRCDYSEAVNAADSGGSA